MKLNLPELKAFFNPSLYGQLYFTWWDFFFVGKIIEFTHSNLNWYVKMVNCTYSGSQSAGNYRKNGKWTFENGKWNILEVKTVTEVILNVCTDIAFFTKYCFDFSRNCLKIAHFSKIVTKCVLKHFKLPMGIPANFKLKNI